MNRTILITGATSGFGKAIAEKFASTGDHLLITGRRSDRLNKIAESLSAQFKVRILPLVFDVQDKQQVKETLSKIPTAWQAIDILINNAGYFCANRFCARWPKPAPAAHSGGYLAV